MRRSGIVRRGYNGSTVPTRSWSRRIRSSPGSASSRTPARGSRPPRPSPPRCAPRTGPAAAALALPLSLHTATGRQGKIGGAGEVTLRDASSRATKAFYPALSMCDLIFSGVFERHPRLTLAIVEFELAWVPHVLSTMDYTYRERHGEAIYRFKNGMLPSDFFRRNVVLSFQ